MTQRAMPFFESAEEATRHAIAVSGRPMKQVAGALWPDKSPAAAHTQLMNALNDNRTERLTFDQHLFIANYCGEFDVLRYAAHQCNHSAPAPQAPEEQVAALQAALFAKAGELRGVLASIEQMQSRLKAA